MLSVALCTYNGEKYIQEQLESLASQVLQPDELIVSDDASRDNTISIVREFAKHAPFEVRIAPHDRNLGVTRNFSDAIGYCRGDYIALCDQDDIWLPEKLAHSMSCMLAGEATHGRDVPLLVHTDLQVTDKNMLLLQPSMLRAQGLRHETEMEDALRVLLAQNYVTGCTVLMNRALAQCACPIPDSAAIHDWWLALCAAALGHILFLDEATLLYRQHGKNQVGARNYLSMASIQKLLSFKKVRHSMERALQQDLAFLKTIRADKERLRIARDYLQAICEKDTEKVRALGIRMQGSLKNFLFHTFLWLWKEHFAAFAKNKSA